MCILDNHAVRGCVCVCVEIATYVEVWWVALDTHSELCGCNDNGKLLCGYSGGQGDVYVDVLDGLIPL